MSDYLSRKTGQEVILPTKNVSPNREDVSLGSDLQRRLEDYLRRDIVIYNFVKEKCSYDKREHFDELSRRLKDC